MYCEYLWVRSLYPCSAEEHAAASRLQCPCRTWLWSFWWGQTTSVEWTEVDMMEYICLVLAKEVTTFMKNAQLPDGATRVTWKTWRHLFWRKIDQGVEGGSWEPWLKCWMESFGAHNDMLHCFCMNWWFWYVVIAVGRKHRVIHADSQKVPGRYVTQLGWMSPAKSWRFGVIIVLLGTMNFAFSRLLLVIPSLFSRVFVNIVLGACTLHVVQGMNHCMSQIQLMVPSIARQSLTTCHFSYHGVFFLEDPRVSKWMPWIEITSLGCLCDNVPSASMR